MKKRFAPYAPAIVIFVCALLVRVVYNLTVAHGYVPKFDANFYNTLAIHVNSEHCFCLQSHVSDTGRAPFWPFIIAALYTLTGTNNLHARLFLCLLGSGTCLLTYYFARDIFNRRIALLVGLVAALYPGLFIYDGWLYSESAYTFFVMSFAYALFRMQRTPRTAWTVACGISLACAALTRPNGISLFVLVFVWAVCMLRMRVLSWRKAIQVVLVITCLTFGLIAPWTVRNYLVSHKFILVATGGGAVLAGAYNDAAITSLAFGYPGMWMPTNRIRPPLTDFSDAGETAYGYHWIAAHPGEMPYLLSQHFINMWRPYTSEEGLPVREFPARRSSQVVWALMTTTPVVIIFLAACGLVVTFRSRRKELLVPYLVIGSTIVLCVALYGSSRFRAPIEPLLVLLAGGAIWWLISTEPGTLRSLLHRKHATTTYKTEPETANV